jgi:hypothetical protein
MGRKREEVGKCEGGWIQCKYYVYMYVNGKIVSVETMPGIESGGWKRMVGAWIQVLYIWYIVRTFVNAALFPQHNDKIFLKYK